MHGRGAGTADLLRRVREDATLLIADPAKELRSFRVARSTAAGAKRGTGRGSFIDSLLDAVDEFYEQVIQVLKPWMPAPPKLRSQEEVVPVEADVDPAVSSSAISSQDGPEPADVRPAAEDTVLLPVTAGRSWGGHGEQVGEKIVSASCWGRRR